MIPHNLGELLRASAIKHPAKVAIVFGQKKIGYMPLNELTDHIAAGLIELRTPDVKVIRPQPTKTCFDIIRLPLQITVRLIAGTELAVIGGNVHFLPPSFKCRPVR